MYVCICATPNLCHLPHCILFPVPFHAVPYIHPIQTLTGSRVYRAEKPYGTLASHIQICTLHRKGNKMPNQTTSPGRFPFGNAIRRAGSGFCVFCVLPLHPLSPFSAFVPPASLSAQLSESVCPCTLHPTSSWAVAPCPTLVLNYVLRLGASGGTLIHSNSTTEQIQH